MFYLVLYTIICSWWNKTTKGCREKSGKDHKSHFAESPSVFFFFSCHSSHSVVIVRVRRSSNNFPCSWNAVASATNKVLNGGDERLGTHQLSARWHRVARSQAYCFPQCRSSKHWQAIREDCPKWSAGVVTQLLCRHSQWLEQKSVAFCCLLCWRSFFAISLGTLQKSVTSSAATEIGGDASLDTSPAAQIVGRLSI